MTRLDDAFIRAYRKLDKPHPAPPAPKLADLAVLLASSPPAPLVPAMEAAPKPQTQRPSPIPAGRPRIDAPNAEHKPHWTSRSVPATVDAVSSTKTMSPLLAGAMTSTGYSPVAVSSISHPTPPAPPPPLVIEEPDEKPFNIAAERAAFEVERFQWPEQCAALLKAADGQFDAAAELLTQASAVGQKLLLLTSCHRGEGRTQTAICLARCLAERRLRVAIVDFDFGRPQLARQLKLLPQSGWDETLAETLPLGESWIESVADGVVAVPLRESASVSRLQGNSRWIAMLEVLRAQHDVVLVDAGPLEDPEQRQLLGRLAAAEQVDAAAMVRDVRSTTSQMLTMAKGQLDAIGIRRWDVIENFA